MVFDFSTSSAGETERFAESFASLLKSGDIITLDGDLGAGKTCFTRGLVRGMGSDAPVTSPTFTIVNEYDGGRLEVFHFDTYRLGDSEEFLASGLDEYFAREGVSVIEWSSIIRDILPTGIISFELKGSGDVRDFHLSIDDGRGGAAEQIIKEIRN